MLAPHLHQLNSMLLTRVGFGYVYKCPGKKDQDFLRKLRILLTHLNYDNLQGSYLNYSYGVQIG